MNITINWDAAKKVAGHSFMLGLAGLFALAVVALIVIFVFDIKDAAIRDYFAAKPVAAKSAKTGKSKKGGRDVRTVRQYSEFITVKHQALKLSIITGIRYDDSVSQKIVAQWCYASMHKRTGEGFQLHLTLKEEKAGKQISISPPSAQTLQQFDLTQSQAQNLISYCRFK